MPDLKALLEERLRELGQEGLLIPPPIYADMQAEALDYRPGEALTVRFPVLARYHNPMGTVQGGMIVAAIDNTLGPLSYLVAPPSVTTQLNTSFLRPARGEDAHLDVEGRLAERAGSYLFFRARVSNPEGKTVALATATTQIVRLR